MRNTQILFLMPIRVFKPYRGLPLLCPNGNNPRGNMQNRGIELRIPGNEK
jgi:hypothetical protein